MRSTFDLPDELIKQAKIAAVQRGTTLRELVADGLRQVLGHKPAQEMRPPDLPDIKLAADAPLRRMSVEEIKALDAEQEAERLNALYRRH